MTVLNKQATLKSKILRHNKNLFMTNGLSLKHGFGGCGPDSADTTDLADSTDSADSADSTDSADSADSTDSADLADSYFNPHLDRLVYF